MEFISNQDTLAKHLNALSRVVNNKPGLPILANILVEADKGKLNVVATDLELGLRSRIGADVTKSGKTTVPAKEFAEFVNTVNAKKLSVQTDGTKLRVSTTDEHGSHTEINTIKPDEYPTLPTIQPDKKPLFILTKDQVETIHTRVSFATATDDVKPVMTGVLIELEKDSATFVGADGLRLSRQIIKLVSPANFDEDEKTSSTKKILVSARAFNELASIVNEFEAEDSQNIVEVYLLENANQVIFKYNEVELSARMIDGMYPDYKAVIPTGYQTRATFERKDFQDSLKIVNIIARNVFGHKIILTENKEEGLISLSATRSEVGNNESSFPAKIEGDDMKMAFSAKFLGDFLSHVDGSEIVFDSIAPEQAGVFRIKGDKDFLHLIMPMRF